MRRLVCRSFLYWIAGGSAWAFVRGKEKEPVLSASSAISLVETEAMAPASHSPPAGFRSGSNGM